MNIYQLGDYLVGKQNQFQKLFKLTQNKVQGDVLKLCRGVGAAETRIYPLREDSGTQRLGQNRLFYMFSGHCELNLATKNLLLQAGNIFWLKADVPHQIFPLKHGSIMLEIDLPPALDLELISQGLPHETIISQEMLAAFSQQLALEQYVLFECTKLDDPAYVIERLICEQINNDSYALAVVSALAHLCLVEVFRGGFFIPEKKYIRRNKYTKEDFLNYLDVHYQRTSLSTMALFFGYNSNYISNVLKKETGRSFMELLLIKRMSVAAILLVNPEISTEEISEYLGYSSTSFFYKKFKEFYGMSPGQMRKNL